MSHGIRSSAAAFLRWATGGPKPLGDVPTTGQYLTFDGTSIVGVDAPAGGGTPTPTAENDVIVASSGLVWVKKTLAEMQTILGLGTIATQAADNVSISGGSVTGITALAVADGGTGASTAPLARVGLAANGGGWRTTGSATDTLVGGDGVVEYTASCTITLPSAAESGVFVGKQITLIAATAGIVFTLQRAGTDTLDGGTSTVEVTMPTVRGTLAVVARSATAWGSLQPSSLGRQDIATAGPYAAVAALDMQATPAIVTADSGTLGGP